MIEQALIDAVADALPEDVTGWCYSASEALYYLAGGKDAGLKPMQCALIDDTTGDRISHWWLTDEEGTVYDLTAAQFPYEWPYHLGKGRGFQANKKKSTVSLLRVLDKRARL